MRAEVVAVCCCFSLVYKMHFEAFLSVFYSMADHCVSSLWSIAVSPLPLPEADNYDVRSKRFDPQNMQQR